MLWRWEAGKLVLTVPINKARYAYDRRDERLSHYSPTRQEGLWLAGGIGEFPNVSLHDLKAEGTGEDRPSGGSAPLASLAGVESDWSIGEFLTIDGSWHSPDGVRVDISSVLVPIEDSDASARALGTAPLLQMWLPTFVGDEDEDEIDRHQYHSDIRPVEAWITDVRAELKIDERDPNGCREAVERARPAKHIIQAFELRADDPWAVVWHDCTGRAIFRSLAWGKREGRGERETSKSGSALQCEPTTFLSELLTTLDRDLRSRYEADDGLVAMFEAHPER
jgi:hypothetical protein